MADEIKAPAEGEPVNQLWRTVKDCVDFLNALRNGKVNISYDVPDDQPGGAKSKAAGRFLWSDKNAVLDLHLRKSSDTQQQLRPFELVKIDDTHIRVVYSLLDGVEPDGFNLGDDPPYVLEVSGSGYVYGEITKDEYGATTGRSIAVGASVPANDPPDDFRVQIGSFYTDGEGALHVFNAGYGPITSCRDWFSYPANYTFEYSN